MAELTEYENYALMIQHCVLAIQQGHSFAVKAEDCKKELTQKTKEATKLLSALNKAEARIRGLLDQAKATELSLKAAEDRAEAAKNVAEVAQAEVKEAKEKEAQAQTELQTTLSTKAAEIREADAKAYAERAADIREEYKKQVRQACNMGYTLNWMAALKELVVPEDSLLRDESRLVVPFRPAPSQSEGEARGEEREGEGEEVEVGAGGEGSTGAKFPTLNEQILDLTRDDEDEVSKSTSPKRVVSEAEV
ncbi:uncharacterized protein LOC114273080 [Camellia sinensis]|uniref:uncharacterized protein LOC114273080 n=1 Tax=Camellia sinensis TaxID=4442 RepID=UPI001035F2B0|nr:uncharacterized protein LOC114273080 [Camellia sinensis]